MLENSHDSLRHFHTLGSSVISSTQHNPSVPMATSASPSWNCAPQCKDAAELLAWSNLLLRLYFPPFPLLRHSLLGMFFRLIRAALKPCGPEKSQQKDLGIPYYLLSLQRSHGFPGGALPLSSQIGTKCCWQLWILCQITSLKTIAAGSPHHPLSTQNLCSIFLHILSLSLCNTLMRHEIIIPITLLDR